MLKAFWASVTDPKNCNTTWNFHEQYFSDVKISGSKFFSVIEEE